MIALFRGLVQLPCTVIHSADHLPAQAMPGASRLPSIAWSGATECIPVDRIDHASSTFDPPTGLLWATGATRPQGAQGPNGDLELQEVTAMTGWHAAEALRAQMERAKIEHAQMAVALHASQACELELQRQLEVLRAQLRGNSEGTAGAT